MDRVEPGRRVVDSSVYARPAAGAQRSEHRQPGATPNVVSPLASNTTPFSLSFRLLAQIARLSGVCFHRYGMDRSLRAPAFRAPACLDHALACALPLRLGRGVSVKTALLVQPANRLVPTILADHLVAGDIPGDAGA